MRDNSSRLHVSRQAVLKECIVLGLLRLAVFFIIFYLCVILPTNHSLLTRRSKQDRNDFNKLCSQQTLTTLPRRSLTPNSNRSILWSTYNLVFLISESKTLDIVCVPCECVLKVCIKLCSMYSVVLQLVITAFYYALKSYLNQTRLKIPHINVVITTPGQETVILKKFNTFMLQ